MHISAKIITRELLEEEQMLLNVYLTKRDLQYFVTYQKPILDGVMQPAFIEVSCDGDDSEMLTEQLREFVRAAEKAWGAAPCTAIYQYMDSSAYGDSGVYWIGSPEACLKELDAAAEQQITEIYARRALVFEQIWNARKKNFMVTPLF